MLCCCQELGASGPSVQHLFIPGGRAEDVLRALQQLWPPGHDQPPDQPLHPEGALPELRTIRGRERDVLWRVQTLPAQHLQCHPGDHHITSDQADHKVGPSCVCCFFLIFGSHIIGSIYLYVYIYSSFTISQNLFVWKNADWVIMSNLFLVDGVSKSHILVQVTWLISNI